MEGKVSATIYYRSTSMGGWPDSPHSNTLELARPAKPCAPCVSPAGALLNIVKKIRYSQSEVVVTYALPALSFKGSVKVEGGGTISYVRHVQKRAGFTYADLVPSFADFFSPASREQDRLQFSLLFTGVEYPAETDVEFSISVAAFNGVGWSDFSEATKVRLLNHVPMAPCAPTLTEIGEDSVRVHFTRPPTDSRIPTRCMNILMNVVPGGPKLYYSTTDDLIGDMWRKTAYSTGRLISVADYNRQCAECGHNDQDTCGMPCWKTCCVVTGLAPNTEYEVKALGVNGYGDGPASAPTRFKTLPGEVEVTGVQTADERDEEAKKHAIDVDAADEPVAKRVKSEP